MKPWELVRMAMADLTLHKFRSALATIGIVFGVASVIAMISISQGAQRETLARIELLGVDNMVVRSQKPPITDTENKQDNRRFLMEYGLKRIDLEHVRDTFPSVRYAVGLRNMRQKLFTADGRQLDLNVVATEPEYLHVTRSSVARGRFLTAMDQIANSTVCVVGCDAARKLFEYRDPVGQSLHVGQSWFTVVGILQNASAIKDSGGEDINNQVFIPLKTAQARYGDVSYTQQSGSVEAVKLELDGVAIQMEDADLVIPSAARMEQYLKRTHPRKDYDLLVPMELLRQKAATQRIFAIVMASIAGISLLIGGIGIMNIMLANVYDRRKEIGMRRALGARRNDIIHQFVLEASTLTTLGGLAGVGVGYLLAVVISRYAGWPTMLTPVGIVLGVSLATLTGLVFGLWPARQAAMISPIEALRSD